MKIKKMKVSQRLIGSVLFTLVSIFTFASTKVTDLVCEYHVNPIGIDVEKPRLSWQIFTTKPNFMQKAYEIQVFSNSDPIWTSGKVESDQSTQVVYEGKPLKSMQRVYWKVRVWDKNNQPTDWSKPAFWETGLLDISLWSAKWITSIDNEKLGVNGPSNYFRKEFTVTKKLSSARVYITSLGLYELYLNGKKVGNDLFTPGWTSYKKRLQYQTYDIIDLLKEKNAVGALLGDGWYRGRLGWIKGNKPYGTQLALLVQIQLNYSDGTSQTIISDKDWKIGQSPVLSSSIYDGENYDANLEKKDWCLAGYDDKSWTNAITIEHSKSIIVAPQGVPVRAIQEITPLKIITTPKGETVWDLGQNMVGWVRLKVKGTKGQKATIKFAETLDKQGNFYTENLRSAISTDVYILKGGDEETYEPHFTFHGFRYVKVEGLTAKPEIENITGIVIHSDMKPTGTFTCSDSMINKLQKNIQWGQKGNFLDIPTDCPQRDERLGWTGDAQVFAATAAYNFDVSAFYTKWLGDMAADQLPDGQIPFLIPNVVNGNSSSTAWADAAIIIPWNIYKTYGDKRILEVQYNSMKGWVDYMNKRAGDNYLWKGDTHFGDWLDFASNKTGDNKGVTDKDLIANAYFYHSTDLVSKMAGIIGKNADSDKYAELAKKIKIAFNNEFVTANGRLVSQTQTAYGLALSFGLLPENLVETVATQLANDVNNSKQLTTGFVGTPTICNSLSASNHDDLAFMLVNRKKYPSWLYPITMGATTIWERWDGQKPDSTFQSSEMNSFNHYSYGAIGEWLYSRVAGLNIDIKNPGYKHIIFSPHTGGGLTNANAEYLSMYGLIKSGWKLNENTFTYSISVPANTTGTVILPIVDADKLQLNNSVLPIEMKKNLIVDKNGIKIEIGSGNYQFSYAVKNELYSKK